MHPFFHRSDGSLLRHLAWRAPAARFAMARCSCPWPRSPDHGRLSASHYSRPSASGARISSPTASPPFASTPTKWSFEQLRVFSLLNSIQFVLYFFIQAPPLRLPGRSRLGALTGMHHHACTTPSLFAKHEQKVIFVFPPEQKDDPSSYYGLSDFFGPPDLLDSHNNL